jgi:hypothetical protein
MSLNISDKTVSLIVQNYLSSLVLITKTFIGDTTISDLKKRTFETWRVDCSGLEIKTILFEWTKPFTWNLVSMDDKKMSCFVTEKKFRSAGHHSSTILKTQ